MSLSPTGSVANNLYRVSTESVSDFERQQRQAVENKFYFLKETNTPEEFEYIVDAELRRGTTGEFGLPAKELFRRMGERFRKTFRHKQPYVKTIQEQLFVPMSDKEIHEQALGAARHMYAVQQGAFLTEQQATAQRKTQAIAAARAAWNASNVLQS